MLPVIKQGLFVLDPSSHEAASASGRVSPQQKTDKAYQYGDQEKHKYQDGEDERGVSVAGREEGVTAHVDSGGQDGFSAGPSAVSLDDFLRFISPVSLLLGLEHKCSINVITRAMA